MRRGEVPCYVYFARAGEMMKIGCSVQPTERLKQIAEWIPFKTHLVAIVPGSFSLESDFHAYFSDSWSHLEWFHITPKMLEVVDAINSGTFVSVPRLPRDQGKELGKTLKKRASRRITMAEKRAGVGGFYSDRPRPAYLRQAMASFGGSHKPPPSAEALAAIARYERELAALTEGEAA